MGGTQAFDAEVAVVGLGAWGSSTLWRLATRGVDVIGIERFGIGHEMGSTHGATRLFRVACLEHPGLVPLAQRSRDLWRELETVSGSSLLDQVGAIMIGPKDGSVIAGTLEAASAHGLAAHELPLAEVAERFPQFADVDPTHVGVWDPDAGIARPEDGVRAAVGAARSLGARVFADTRVTDVELVPGGVVLHSAAASWRVRQVVVTAGSWLGKLVPGLPLQARRTPMLWFRPPATDTSFDAPALPAFIQEIDDSMAIWGHGATLGHGVKIGMQDVGRNFTDCDPDTVDRAISWERDVAELSALVARTFPGLDPRPDSVVPCMVTNSPDLQFLLGRPGGDSRLVVGGGCSGHGFKHATGIGDALAAITVGDRPVSDLAFTDPDRDFVARPSVLAHR
ncbi:N-methyl-L-tryptophan oxidase [Kineococcus sp. SYSU DK001]|uniref:N-methyl-L-tryptophan oxidase n=1 Tax=Kineococcus sp. SYSU DK001 TaxID=3383122 RepID=UPI003D7D9FB4